MLVVLLDFSDASPLLSWVGNLDHIFGSQFWHAMDVIYPAASIATFLLFGRESFYSGRDERIEKTRKEFSINLKALLLLLIFGVLICLIDLDDILKVLGINSALTVSQLSPYYWLPMMAIYPFGAIALFLAFGKVCFDIGKN